jgi:hypothetical protein
LQSWPGTTCLQRLLFNWDFSEIAMYESLSFNALFCMPIPSVMYIACQGPLVTMSQIMDCWEGVVKMVVTNPSHLLPVGYPREDCLVCLFLFWAVCLLIIVVTACGQSESAPLLLAPALAGC